MPNRIQRVNDSQEHATSLAQKAVNLDKRSGSENIISLVTAAISGVPIVGGPIVSLLNDFLPNAAIQRVRVFAIQLAQELESVNDQLHEEFVQTDQFGYLFRRVFEDVSRDYQQARLAAYQSILVHAMTTDVSAAVREGYLAKVEELTDLHLQILAQIQCDPQRETRKDGGQAVQIIAEWLPGVPSEQVAACIQDLDRLGITQCRMPALPASMHGNRLMDPRPILTPYGQGFMDFIS